MYNLAKALRDVGRVAEAFEAAKVLMAKSRGRADRYSQARRRLDKPLEKLATQH